MYAAGELFGWDTPQDVLVVKDLSSPEKSADDLFGVKSKKQKQFDIIQNSNPMQDDYHTGIRSVNDIKSFDEVTSGDDASYTPDYTEDMASAAKMFGQIDVYSSKPIENGVFVTPSKMEAQNYAGSGQVYHQVVNLDDIAWIDTIEGQFAKGS